jgi:hypothetical protein
MKSAVDFFTANFTLGAFFYALASFILSYLYNIPFLKIYFPFLVLLSIVVFYFLIKLDFSSFEDQKKGDTITIIVGMIAPILLVFLGILAKGFILYSHICKVNGESIFKLGTVVINLLSIIGVIMYVKDGTDSVSYCGIFSLKSLPKKIKIVVFLLSLIPFAILDDILLYLYLTKQINFNFQIENQETVLLLLVLNFFGIQFYLASKLRDFLLKKSGVRGE